MLTQTTIDRALASDTDECIIWPHALDHEGYPKARRQQRLVAVHRLVCELTYGPAPEGRPFACHRRPDGTACESRACINPKHLRWDSPKGNTGDWMAHKGQSGELNPNARLTAADVAAIRLRLSQGHRHRDIAADYGVSRPHVTTINTGTRWR